MPSIHIKTNQPISTEAEVLLKTRFGEAITCIPRKTEQWLMCTFSDRQRLWLSGSDAPAAIAELSLFGQIAPDSFAAVAGKLTDILSETLGISQDRIYCACMETPLWSWNGKPLGKS